MKHLFRQNLRLQMRMLPLVFISLILLFTGCNKGNHEPLFEISTVATGLASSMGIENGGGVWVAKLDCGGTSNMIDNLRKACPFDIDIGIEDAKVPERGGKLLATDIQQGVINEKKRR